MNRSAIAMLFSGLSLLSAASCSIDSSVVRVEERSPAIEGGELVESIGIETLGGVFTPLLNRGESVPCQVTEVFATAADGQEQIELRLFRGTATLVRDASSLGRYEVSGLPKRDRGKVRVAVTLAVSSSGAITLAAAESSGHRVLLRRAGEAENVGSPSGAPVPFLQAAPVTSGTVDES